MVFSRPPAEIAAEEFETFYERHVQEILTVPGWVSGRRFRVSAVDGEVSFPYSYLALYVIDGDADEATQRLFAASDTDQITIPAWFELTPWLTWTAPIELDQFDPTLERYLHFCFSVTPPENVRESRRLELRELDIDEGLPRFRWAALETSTTSISSDTSTSVDVLCMTLGDRAASSTGGNGEADAATSPRVVTESEAMTNKKLYLIFSRQPDDVSDSEWNSWYERHMTEEILPTPGFVSGQRFSVTPTVHTESPYTHLALYEYEGRWQDWEEDLNSQVANGEFTQPEFQDRIEFGYLDCEPLGVRHVATARDARQRQDVRDRE